MTVRTAIVAGSDAGHAFPAFALAERFAGVAEVTVFTDRCWQSTARRAGIDVAELPALKAEIDDDDADAGAKLSIRAARMAVELAPLIEAGDFDLVVSDVITVAGGWAAQLCGRPWIELSPHPLYRPSRGLPPIGSGLAPGTGLLGRLRDSAMRAATSVSVRSGERQRARARASIGLPGGTQPDARFVATLPGLEVYRPDWPADTHLIGPLLWEPTDDIFDRPAGSAPLVVLAPSTAVTGAADMVTTVLRALSAEELGTDVRVVLSALDSPSPEAVAGFGGPITAGLARQDEVLRDADVVICGAGHGMLAKSLLAGVPVVAIPGGGDQWELANRVQRQGAGEIVRTVGVSEIAAAVRRVLGSSEHRSAAGRIAATATEVSDPVPIAQRVARESRRP